MRVRFLRQTASDHPTFPFQAGQIIDLPRLTPDLERWLAQGEAILIPEDAETATLGPPPALAVAGSRKPRGRR